MSSKIFKRLFKEKKYHELKNKNQYKVESENLAVPEVHVDRGNGASDVSDVEKEEDGQPEEAADESITYDNVAIPEIHVHHQKKEH